VGSQLTMGAVRAQGRRVRAKASVQRHSAVRRRCCVLSLRSERFQSYPPGLRSPTGQGTCHRIDVMNVTHSTVLSARQITSFNERTKADQTHIPPWTIRFVWCSSSRLLGRRQRDIIDEPSTLEQAMDPLLPDKLARFLVQFSTHIPIRQKSA